LRRKLNKNKTRGGGERINIIGWETKKSFSKREKY